MLGQPYDTRFEPVTPVELAGDGIIFGTRNIPQQVPVPFDAHGARIVRIVRFAHQFQRGADLELIPQLLAFVELESG